MVNFFSDGFFGYSDDVSFEKFTPAHFIPLAVVALCIFLVFRYRKRIVSWKHEENLRFALGIAMIICELGYFWRLLYVGPVVFFQGMMLPDFMSFLPFQICEWTCIISAFMIFKKSHFMFGICFFTALSFSVMALVSPDVISHTGPQYFRYYQFFGEHALPVIAVFYMMFVHGFRVKMKDIIKPVVMLGLLLIPGCYMNSLPDHKTNYLYLKSNYLGIFKDNMTQRIIAYILFAVALFFVMYLVEVLICRRAGKTQKDK